MWAWPQAEARAARVRGVVGRALGTDEHTAAFYLDLAGGVCGEDAGGRGVIN